MTGDPHIDARLEPWRPEDRRHAIADRLPAPGRERRARVMLAVVLLIVVSILVGYLALAVAGAGATGAT